MPQYEVWVQGGGVGERTMLQKTTESYSACELVSAILENSGGENLELGVTITGADQAGGDQAGAAPARFAGVHPAAAATVARLTGRGQPAPAQNPPQRPASTPAADQPVRHRKPGQ